MNEPSIPSTTSPPRRSGLNESGSASADGARFYGEEPGRPSLGRLALRGGVWTTAGHVASQALRLAGNLILTRLLFPEAFGLMALVQIVFQGVQMFSDFGIRGSIVYHSRGEDEAFRNTAWTIQILRGGALWLGVCLLSWPASRFYAEPRLTALLPVVGLAALLNGFGAVAVYTLIRRLTPERKIVFDLSSQLIGLSVTIPAALATRSVWALVAGGLANALSRMVLSHFLIPEHRSRLALERKAVSSLLHFGKWILVSTALTFLLTQGDRIVLGKMLTAAELGVYAIAFFLAQSIPTGVLAISRQVLIPLYARLAQQDAEKLRRETLRVRGLLLVLTLPPTWILAVFGPQVVDLLYDQRYSDAGWMLQILALGIVGTLVTSTASSVLLAMGDSFRQMWLQIVRCVLLIAGIAIGATLGGVRGLLIGISTARLVEYAVLVPLITPYGVWLPALDALAFGSSALVIGGGLWAI